MACTFCDLIRGAAEVSVCYEDAEALAFMDIQPVNAGHVLVVPRQHYESLLDVPQELGVHLFGVTMKLAGAVKRVTNCEGLNLVVNSGVAAGQDVFHYHVHIIPRMKGDGFDIELPFSGSEMPDRTVLDMTAARIIAAMRDPIRHGASSSGGGSEEEAVPQRATAPRGMPMGGEVAEELSLRMRGERVAAIEVHREPSAAASSSGSHVTGGRATKPFRLVDMEGAHGELVCDFDGAA